MASHASNSSAMRGAWTPGTAAKETTSPVVSETTASLVVRVPRS